MMTQAINQHLFWQLEGNYVYTYVQQIHAKKWCFNSCILCRLMLTTPMKIVMTCNMNIETSKIFNKMIMLKIKIKTTKIIIINMNSTLLSNKLDETHWMDR